ncbi:hypothetical protein ACHAWC_008225 [Mediolabrus comicus]
MILLSLFVTIAVMVATSSAIELRGALLRTTELLQEHSVYSDCVKSCTNYFNNKDPNHQPNIQNAPNFCRDEMGLYGVDFNQCMKETKAILEGEGIDSKNGHVGVWCTQKYCTMLTGSVGVE